LNRRPEVVEERKMYKVISKRKKGEKKYKNEDFPLDFNEFLSLES
jgi:hypothetical protein